MKMFNPLRKNMARFLCIIAKSLQNYAIHLNAYAHKYGGDHNQHWSE